MNNMYKKIVITLVFLCAWITQTFASHFMGADLTYQCVGPCTYRITQSFYLDCDGAATQPYLPVTAGNAYGINPISFTFPAGATCNVQPTPIGTGTLVNWAEVTPICPSITTACELNTNPLVSGVVGATYYQDYNFCNIPANCSPVCIVWSNCCRNYAITSGADGDGIYTSTCIDLNMSPCNSSPTFNNPPVPYICAGQPFTFSQGAYDPDGDSLSYSLGTCYSGAGTSVGYNAGYSAAAPLGATWTVNVDPTTGDVTFTPNPTGVIVVAVMCIVVKEWRYINGQWVNIGQVSRDMQITVLTCSTTNPQIDSIDNNTLGGVSLPPVGPYQAFACAGSQVCFDIPITNLTAGSNYTMYWNHNIPGGTFSDASNPFVIDTIFSTTPVAHFCWTPTLPGVYTFLVTIKDDHCPIPGSSQRTITIYVSNGLAGSQAVANYISCNDVQFIALPSANSPGPFTYNWSGPGNLSTNPNHLDSMLVNHYPNVGPYPWTLSIKDTFGCAATVNGTVNIVNGAVADAGPDVSMCSGYQFQLGVPPIAGQNYQWSASPGWTTSTTISNPTFSLVNNGTTPLTYNLTLQVSNFGCTTFDYTTITVNPTPAVDITPNTPTICEGDSITLFATGGTSYLWNDGTLTNSITVSPTQNTTYSVVSFVNGCSSLPTFETINVLHGPAGQISGTMGVCSGQSTILTASSCPTCTFQWNTGTAGSTLSVPNIQQNVPVWMIPSNGGCPGDTVKTEVVVYAAPAPNFTSDTVCAGTPTFFNNLSSISTGNIISWAWNFNDPLSGANNLSNAQVPTHTYAQNGTYQAVLTATSENGCVSSITQPVIVTAVPVANFTFNNVCVGTPMNFTNQSTIATGNSIVAYSWDFGDGTVDNSNNPNPTHTYADYNVYNATLTVVSNNGCVDRYTKTVFVYPAPVSDFEFETNCLVDGANFTATPTVPNIPSTTGIDYVQNYDWNFGDPTTGANNISFNKDPYHKFSAGGQYPVTLTVTTNHGCVNTTTEFVTVYYQPIAEFTVNDRCANQVAKFVNQSTADPNTPLIGYSWSFGANNVPSFTANPIFNYGLYGPNTYNATLVVTTSEGCKDTITHAITINPVPDPKFIASSECFGNVTTFQNTSLIKTGNINSFNWVSFGDNSGATSPDSNATHLYPTWGTFTATLEAVSDSGCVDRQNQQVIVFPPPLDPVIVNDTVCMGNAAILDLHLDGKDKSNWYLSETDSVAIHQGDSYITLPLSQTNTFYIDVVTSNGCRSINRFPVTAFVFSDADVEITASQTTVQLPANTVTFNTLSPVALTAWSWTFGDGFSSTIASPVHEYQYGDRYNVILRSIDENGCPHVSTKVIEVKRVVNLSVPSAFTPNGDGINDYFQVGVYNVAAFNIRIYNRWGGLVFESSNPGFEWDGKDRNGKPLAEGVYVVVTKIKAFDGGEEEQSSTVTIMK